MSASEGNKYHKRRGLSVLTNLTNAKLLSSSAKKKGLKQHGGRGSYISSPLAPMATAPRRHVPKQTPVTAETVVNAVGSSAPAPMSTTEVPHRDVVTIVRTGSLLRIHFRKVNTERTALVKSLGAKFDPLRRCWTVPLSARHAAIEAFRRTGASIATEAVGYDF